MFLAIQESTGNSGITYQLLFKKMYFVKAREKIATNLEVALTYQQALDEVKTDSLKLLPEERLSLLAQIVKYTHNQVKEAELKSDLGFPTLNQTGAASGIEASLISETVKRILPDAEVAKVDSAFLELVHQSTKNVSDPTMRSIVSLIQTFVHFGATSFHVAQMFTSQLDKDLTLNVSENGISLYVKSNFVEPALFIDIVDIDDISINKNSIQIKAFVPPNNNRELHEPNVFLFYTTGRAPDTHMLVEGYRKLGEEKIVEKIKADKTETMALRQSTVV